MECAKDCLPNRLEANWPANVVRLPDTYGLERQQATSGESLDAMPVRIDTSVLFPAPRGGYIDLEKFRYREWTPALKAAGLRHRRIYDLRHTYASWSLAADVAPAKLAKMMGTSIIQIGDTYHRFLREDEERYGSTLDSYGQVVGL